MKITKALVLFAFALSIVSCNKSNHFGKVLKLNGDADMWVNGAWKPLKKSGVIDYHDTIRSTTGTVEISFRNNGRIVLEPNTKIIVTDSTFNGKNYLFPIIVEGGILCEVNRDRPDEFAFVVYTPVSYAEAHGTHYHVSYAPLTVTSDIDVFDGNVTVYNTADFSYPVQVVPGFATTIIGTARPGKPEKIRYNRFRNVGYMFPPDVCERYEVAFGFPVGPIPFPGALIVPVPVPAPTQVAVPIPVPSAPEPRRERHHPRSNVNVSVSVNGQFPGISAIPVPVPMMPGSVSFSHHGHVPVPVPPLPPMLPVPVPMGIAPVPVPVPMVGVPVPRPGFHGAPRGSHNSVARPKH